MIERDSSKLSLFLFLHDGGGFQYIAANLFLVLCRITYSRLCPARVCALVFG